MRSWADSLLPFLVGFALGVMSALATFSGRISSLEAITAAHGQALLEIREEVRGVSDKLDHCIESCKK